MRRARRWSLGLLCVLFVTLAHANERELTLNIGGRMTTYAPASLLGMPTATSVSIPADMRRCVWQNAQ